MEAPRAQTYSVEINLVCKTGKAVDHKPYSILN